MYYGFYYDWTYILVLIGALISMFASRNDRTRSGRTDSQKKWNL